MSCQPSRCSKALRVFEPSLHGDTTRDLIGGRMDEAEAVKPKLLESPLRQSETGARPGALPSRCGQDPVCDLRVTELQVDAAKCDVAARGIVALCGDRPTSILFSPP